MRATTREAVEIGRLVGASRAGRSSRGAEALGATVARSSCTYHCRACDSHFTSLEAFDAHREGPAGSHRACTFPDLPEGVELVEQTGTCNIAGATAQIGATIYALVRPGKFALEGRESAEGNGKSGVLAA